MASFDLSLTLRTTDAIPALIRARTTDFEDLNGRVLNDGFVTLAGNTGEELWEYRVGEHSRAAYASRLGDYLAVQIGSPENGPALIELDPSTGEVLQEVSLGTTSSSESGIDEESFSPNVADGVRIARDPFDDPALRALSLEIRRGPVDSGRATRVHHGRRSGQGHHRGHAPRRYGSGGVLLHRRRRRRRPARP
ncbi:hypothetical protein [Nocardiopsis sp. CC223A]|uniref:hypothetical protein n=1 Tax=Nocardiopsis sp. CC223A TaxID=3044051 RepID=UPI00278C36CD|nr:hypothetical protein [Nocardiopsis sp. CC223A]